MAALKSITSKRKVKNIPSQSASQPVQPPTAVVNITNHSAAQSVQPLTAVGAIDPWMVRRFA
eukprot:1731720-Heterocapsa_arctica.AAC.1